MASSAHLLIVIGVLLVSGCSGSVVLERPLIEPSWVCQDGDEDVKLVISDSNQLICRTELPNNDRGGGVETLWRVSIDMEPTPVASDEAMLITVAPQTKE